MDRLFKQQDKLHELALSDPIYQMWQQSFEEFQDTFLQFANVQPEEIRNFLYGYADSGRMAQQRLVNLACEYMVFPEDMAAPVCPAAEETV